MPDRDRPQPMQGFGGSSREPSPEHEPSSPRRPTALGRRNSVAGMPTQLPARSLVGLPRPSDGSKNPAQQRTYEPSSESSVVRKQPSHDGVRFSSPMDVSDVSDRLRAQPERLRPIDRLNAEQLPRRPSYKISIPQGDIDALKDRIREKKERYNAGLPHHEALKREVSSLKELREVQNIEKKLADMTEERDQLKAENDSLKADIADGVSLVKETAEAQDQLQNWTLDLLKQLQSNGLRPTQERKPTVWGPQPPAEDEEPRSGN